MAKLSVNINKVATLRNSRGGNNPNLLQVALDCEQFGAEGITIHPRPDERHIRYADVKELKQNISTELNIEGYPTEQFIDLVLQEKPAQVTLVPDAPNALTSDHGWNTKKHVSYLTEIIQEFKSFGIRTSLFVDPSIEMVENAAKTGTDRIELYTHAYASQYSENQSEAVTPFKRTAKIAAELGLGVNAGHDLDVRNLKYFSQEIPELAEVSIGHALICDALYLGLANTIQLYLRQLDH